MSYLQHMCVCIYAQLLQSCQTLCNPMDCSLPGSSVHEIPQARILEWVTMPSPKGSSRPRKQTHVSCISCIEANSLSIEPPGKPDPCCSLSTETPQVQVLLLFMSHVHISICMCDVVGFPGGADDKESTFSAGDPSSVPGSARSPGGGNGKLL